MPHCAAYIIGTVAAPEIETRPHVQKYVQSTRHPTLGGFEFGLGPTFFSLGSKCVQLCPSQQFLFYKKVYFSSTNVDALIGLISSFTNCVECLGHARTSGGLFVSRQFLIYTIVKETICRLERLNVADPRCTDRIKTNVNGRP
uniref:Secreted protein n=1 Tax=Steinernema glaseri TaxID=37863 RepID=A0A1I8AEE3_9BILA